jgi:hypothetical protein
MGTSVRPVLIGLNMMVHCLFSEAAVVPIALANNSWWSCAFSRDQESAECTIQLVCTPMTTDKMGKNSLSLVIKADPPPFLQVPLILKGECLEADIFLKN